MHRMRIQIKLKLRLRSVVVGIWSLWLLLGLLAMPISANSSIQSSSSIFESSRGHAHHHHQRRFRKRVTSQRQYYLENSQNSPSSSETRRVMDCQIQSEPIWIRNKCHDGYLAVISDRRVVTLNSGVDQHDNLVQLRSEVCTSVNASLFEPVRIRLFSEATNRYICFNRRGRLKSMSKRRAHRLGNLCAFYERPIPSQRHVKLAVPDPPHHYFNLQSAYNPRWYAGFGPNTAMAMRNIGPKVSPRGHAISLPRRMGHAHHDKLVRPAKKCDFQFYKGIFTVHQESSPSLQWSGMLDKINELESNSDHHNSQGAFKLKKKKSKKYFSTSSKSSKKNKSRISNSQMKYHQP